MIYESEKTLIEAFEWWKYLGTSKDEGLSCSSSSSEVWSTLVSSQSQSGPTSTPPCTEVRFLPPMEVLKMKSVCNSNVRLIRYYGFCLTMEY